MRRSERYRRYADNARARAQTLSDAAHEALDRIPPGQPIVGVRDRNYRGRAWAKMDKAAAEARTADEWSRRADSREHYERRLDAAQQTPSLEGVSIGDEVIACFTNSYRRFRFRGVIVGRTVNSWKVKTLGPETPYDEPPGRVFAIPALGHKATANHRVYSLSDWKEKP